MTAERACDVFDLTEVQNAQALYDKVLGARHAFPLQGHDPKWGDQYALELQVSNIASIFM